MLKLIQRVRFLTDCHQAGAVRFERGEHYPVCPATLREVRNGAASLCMAEMDEETHAEETTAALSAWNAANAATVAADPALRCDPNPAATLVKQHLAELSR